MRTTEVNGKVFNVAILSQEAELSETLARESVAVYQDVFAFPPYLELYTEGEARQALTHLFEQNGQLLVGTVDGSVVGLAGGYPKTADVYYVEELAVARPYQGVGYGRALLQALLNTDQAKAMTIQEICTTASNSAAIALYESEGFRLTGEKTIAIHRRVNDVVAIDERVFLRRVETQPPFWSEPERLRRVVVTYPSGNTTAIVFDQRLEANRANLNDELSLALSKVLPGHDIEQCCFITKPRNPSSVARVEMFGGEFCGNATRSVAWLATQGINGSGLIEASGVNEALRFTILDGHVELEMPVPASNAMTSNVADGTLVRLEGITHLVSIQPAAVQPSSARGLLTEMLSGNRYGLTSDPAVGVSFYDPETGMAEFCVWVREVDTIFDETACGSGTSAIGIASRAVSGKAVDLQVIQPSGQRIRTKTDLNAETNSIQSSISGSVSILFDGEIQLP